MPLLKYPASHHFTAPQRLTANYAPYPDGNVPRQGLYFSYRRVCDQYGIPHINTATLGKAIRLCFPTIKTRRLGVRGNSKYHCAYTASVPLLMVIGRILIDATFGQIAAFVPLLRLKPNGFRITSENQTIALASSPSTPLAQRKNLPIIQIKAKNGLTKTKTKIQRGPVHRRGTR